MLPEETIASLGRTRVFEGMEYPDLRTVSRFAQVRKFNKEEVIITEGQKAGALFIVLDGQVKVKLFRGKPASERARFTDVDLNVLGPLDCFGEYSLIDHKPASATVMAVVPTAVFELTRTNFENLVADNDRIARIIYSNLLRILIERLRKKDQELDLSFGV
jgi:CRP-like cAMP-binding protein